MKTINICILFLFLSFSFVCNSQIPYIYDYDHSVDTINDKSIKNSIWGKDHTPKGNLHVLVIFVGYTNTTSADDVGYGDMYWAHNDIPVWAQGSSNFLFDSEASTIGGKKNLSSF